MINIISKSIISKNIRGPQKVVNNLINGLNLIGYPYIINQRLDATKRLWIHDDKNAFKKISKLPSYIHTLAGPNLFLIPQEIPETLSLPRTIYLQPSENTKKVWLEKGYNKSPVEVWPAGINIPLSQPCIEERKKILVYFKQREQKELETVINILVKLNLNYNIIKYGSYYEKEYQKKMNESKYIIWLGCYENQGIALLEALSSNIPILVIDKEPESKWEMKSTSAPYFNDQCGIKIKDFESLSEKISFMEKQWTIFKPKKYIEENLSLAKQARDFIFFYEKHFNLSFEEGLKEKIIKKGKWINATFLFKIYILLKDTVKNYI